jgi:hypothetical protein
MVAAYVALGEAMEVSVFAKEECECGETSNQSRILIFQGSKVERSPVRPTQKVVTSNKEEVVSKMSSDVGK